MKLESSMNSEYELDGLDKYSICEVVVKIVFFDLIFSTGLHIHEKLSWLSTSPDGLFLYENRLIPVEIKSTKSDKTDRRLIIEYYHQLQLHCEILKSGHVLLIIFRLNLGKITTTLVQKDSKFCREMIERAEKNYFQEIPRILCRKLSYEQYKQLVENAAYQKKYIKMFEVSPQADDKKQGAIKKNLHWDDVKLIQNATHPNLPIQSKEFLNTILLDNQNRFKKEFENYFTDLFDLSSEVIKKIEWNILKKLIEEKRNSEVHS